ncbi:MAG: aspartate kinase, partial [Bacteroidota bacterium]
MKVLKFGGTSVGTPERIVDIGKLLLDRHQAGEQMTVVTSAFGGVTDALIKCSDLAASGDKNYLQIAEQIESRHHDAIRSLGLSGDEVVGEITRNFVNFKNLLHGVFLVREASARTMDFLLSFGERNAAPILAAYLSTLGLPARYLDARQIIKTNKEFGRAKVNFSTTEKLIQDRFRGGENFIEIVTGFIATDIGGLTTTLGRGGSDYTAAIIAGALRAEVLEIWTDVDGVLTSNPKIVENAYTIPELSYDEAMELSHFGAKVIYPPTIQPALAESIPIYIKNTFNPSFMGTLISDRIPRGGKGNITGVTGISDITLLTLAGSGL